ncbi:unannotated protein [freshwater metagenome]|uniref:Unannotated protein n=1 Tax=freshwater metagenome TaxID=449393 RepID=A0A6J7UVY1_9ZZZZ
MIDLALGANVDPPRRLVEQQDPWRQCEELREHHLLLVAARQPKDRLADPARADGQVGVALLCVLAGPARDHYDPTERVAAECGEVDVALDGVRHESVGATLLRDERDTPPLRPADRVPPGDRHRGPRRLVDSLYLDRAAPAVLCAREQPHNLAPTRPGEPGDAEHLALPQFETHVPTAAAREPHCTEQHTAVGAFARREDRGHRPTGHRGDEVGDGHVRDVPLAHLLPVAEHGVGVAHLHHLLQSVRDVDDRHTAILEPTHHREQLRRLLIRQRRGRLVEDEYLRVPGEGAGDSGHRLADR